MNLIISRFFITFYHKTAKLVLIVFQTTKIEYSNCMQNLEILQKKEYFWYANCM